MPPRTPAQAVEGTNPSTRVDGCRTDLGGLHGEHKSADHTPCRSTVCAEHRGTVGTLPVRNRLSARPALFTLTARGCGEQQ